MERRQDGVLYWGGEALFGDLHVQSVNGTTGGPLLAVHPAAPGHVQRKSYKWSPDGSRVTILSDHETPMDTHLYLVDPDAAQAEPEDLAIALMGYLLPAGRQAITTFDETHSRSRRSGSRSRARRSASSCSCRRCEGEPSTIRVPLTSRFSARPGFAKPQEHRTGRPPL